MVGTVAGGKKAAATNKAKYGADFYAKIGSEGGSRSHTGGFASEKVGADGLTGFERARIAGRKGGAISKRGPAKRKRDFLRYSPESTEAEVEARIAWSHETGDLTI